MVGSQAEQGVVRGAGNIASEVEYARLALDPVEAVRNIFLALTKTGTVSREDFTNFLKDCGAVDGVNLKEEDVDSAITFATKKQHHDMGSAGLNFHKFTSAMVFLCTPILFLKVSAPVFEGTDCELRCLQTRLSQKRFRWY